MTWLAMTCPGHAQGFLRSADSGRINWFGGHAVMRSLRLIQAIALSLLLIGMQLGSELHALEHVGEALKHSPDHSWTTSGDEQCAICALLAGAATAIAGKVDVGPSEPATHFKPRLALTAIAADAPSYYSSRAPPVPL